MNWKLRFLLWFVNNVQPIREVAIANIEEERKKTAMAAELGKLLFDNKTAVREIKNFKIEDIPVRLYRNSLQPNQKVIIYFHGGGFVFYNIDSHDYVARRLCDMNDATVISVDYRLAPEHSFPAAHEDAYSVIKYVAAHADALNIDASKIILAGDSAGANISACASHHFKNHPKVHIAAQVLIYPWVDGKLSSDSILRYKDGYLLTEKAMHWFQEVYTPNKKDRLNPEVSPIYHKEFKNLPPTFIITAEYDPLKDDGKSYADKLRNANNIVLYKEYKGLIHGFFNLPKLSINSMQSYYDIQAFLRKVV
ncbi:MAG TPA: alpha/beta hydrolase [Chitinophagales bacterium]|nr:alpha/beta hydrolase [Chitinophagales bacterium]